MTNTANFQQKPDFYLSEEQCIASLREKYQTNIRYKNFTQTHFTAGDEDQFYTYQKQENGNICMENISLENNVFNDKISYPISDKYRDLNAMAVFNTFKYIFHCIRLLKN